MFHTASGFILTSFPARAVCSVHANCPSYATFRVTETLCSSTGYKRGYSGCRRDQAEGWRGEPPVLRRGITSLVCFPSDLLNTSCYTSRHTRSRRVYSSSKSLKLVLYALSGLFLSCLQYLLEYLTLVKWSNVSIYLSIKKTQLT